MAWNYNTGANRRARQVRKELRAQKTRPWTIGKTSAFISRTAVKHPAAVVGAVGAGEAAMFGAGAAATAGFGLGGAAIGAAAKRYGRIGRMNAMDRGIREPQLSLRHGFVEPNLSTTFHQTHRAIGASGV